MIIYYTKKILVLFLIFILGTVSFPWNYTLAYFNDEEKSGQNLFSLGSLDFSLNSTADFTPAVAPTYPSVRNVEVINDGTLGFQYRISAVNFSGSLCEHLNLKADLDGEQYNGGLESFIDHQVGEFSDPDNWIFTVSLDNNDFALQNQTCTFDFIFTGWQDNLPDETTGFFDIETLSNTVNSNNWDGVVLNEILPNPEGDDTQTGIQGEWVEIYNNGNTEVDLTGWYIEDVALHRRTISSATTYNGRTVIGPKGSYLEWLVLFMDGQILNNTGDTVTLYDASDNLIDRYTYGSSSTDDDSDSNNTPGGDNETISGDETASNEGKSYARIPDGIGEWIDPIPTPGWTNALDIETAENSREEQEIPVDAYFDLSEQASQSVSSINDADQKPAVEEPVAEEPVEEVVEEPIIEGPVEEPAVEEPIEEPTGEPAIEEPTEEPAVEEPVAEEPVEEVVEELVSKETPVVEEAVIEEPGEEE